MNINQLGVRLMRYFLLLRLSVLILLTFSLLLGDMHFALAQEDPFAAIEEEGNRFVDFLLNKVARIIAAIVAFAYIVRFMTTKRFDLNEFLLFGGCIIALGSVGFIVDYFFQ